MAKRKKKAKKPSKTLSRRLAARLGLGLLLVFAALATIGNWYVHHSRAWLAERQESWPSFVTTTLLAFGNPVGDFTDALGWTGVDAVYEYDEEAPANSVTFAGVPQRTGLPAPADVRVINRGEFLIGWSDSLRHPLWCAYHVTREKRFEDGKRPSFLIDKSIPSAPKPADYTNSGFDRGHMVPNHAIISRFGEEARRQTFLMSNITPQSATLNRGVWRDVEHRIADLWTARYGEIWVIIGCIPSASGKNFGCGIDIPEACYQVIVAQEGLDVRALAVIFPQNVPWGAWPTRNIISIDELEELTGLDFLAELPSFIQDPLEAQLPTRLWPIRARDIFKQIALRFN